MRRITGAVSLHASDPVPSAVYTSVGVTVTLAANGAAPVADQNAAAAELETDVQVFL